MRIIGILGGMGPQATVTLMQRVLDFTHAATDAGHVPLLVCNDPRIPDRTAAIRGTGPSPLPALIEAGRRLEAAGAERIAMPCNTAHFYLPDLRGALRTPFLDLVEATVSEARACVDAPGAVGILATDGTLATGLYRDGLAGCGLQALAPSPQEQRTVMETIYGREGIKAGRISRLQSEALAEIVRSLHANGAQAVIAGCTEIPIVFNAFPAAFPVPMISSIDALARAIVKEAVS